MNVDDDFESVLRTGLASTASRIAVPGGLEAMVRGRARRRERRRVAARTGGVGVAGIVAIGGLVWTQTGHGSSRTVTTAPRTAHPDTPSTGATQQPTSSVGAPTSISSTSVATTAQNVLIVGVDNNACVDPSSPYAGGIGDRGAIGIRSDTIMVLHIDPATSTAALLSLPRDLWVKVPGRGNSRINTAVEPGGYELLARTLDDNFGIRVDHYVQIDFCAFTAIVDAVGGVTVPIPAAIRDQHVGLDLPPGCHTFAGDEALAYVRSRHLETLDAAGVWQPDPTSDLGRIARQQDFMRRTFQAALDKGVLDPSVASGMIDVVQRYLVIDEELSIDDMIAIAHAAADATLTTAQLPVGVATIAASSVLVADLTSPAAAQVLAPFQGSPTPATTSSGTGTTAIVPAAAVVPAVDTTC